MIRLIGVALSALLLAGCGDSSVGSTVGEIKENLSEMKHHLKNNKKKFDHVYKHLEVVNKQLPKLNKQIQDQVVAQADENQKSIRKLGKTAKGQFQHLQDEINAFGKKMAKKGY